MKVIPPLYTFTEDEKKLFVVMTFDGDKRALVERSVIVMSQLLKEVLEDAPADGSEVVTIPVEGVDYKSFCGAFQFMEHHVGDSAQKEIERPLTAELKTLVDPWDYKFLTETICEGKQQEKMMTKGIFQMLNVANFLVIPSLRDLCSAAIANMVRDKTEEEILALFEIKEPFTPAEEEKLLKNYPWLMER